MEQNLLKYIEDQYVTDEPLSSQIVADILRGDGGTCTDMDWSITSEEGLPLLHLAAMNETTPPGEMEAVIEELFKGGAPPNATDDDGDTALEAILTLAEDAERNEDPPTSDDTPHIHMAAVKAILRYPGTAVGDEQMRSVCAWLRKFMPKPEREQVLEVLEARVDPLEVRKVWRSEELLAYLEECAYEAKRPVEPEKIADFLSGGASPRHTQHGASALLLVVLNPYTGITALVEIFRLMLTVDPGSAAVQDCFKKTPLRWAADYENVGTQHGLRKPNPAVLLALMPTMISLLPADVDGGEVCLKVSPTVGSQRGVNPSVPTRFMEGHRVRCRVEAVGDTCSWEEGVIIGLWYRERCWPSDHPGAPYEVRLDIGVNVFALADHDRIIRTEARPAPREANATTSAAAKRPQRFQRRQREDGAWELLDTVSGKARACSPPESDDEE